MFDLQSNQTSIGISTWCSSPIPVLKASWRDVLVDLITGLPLVEGFNVVYTMVDQFSKEIVVFPTTNSVIAPQLALLFRNHVWCKHGMLASIISDHSPQFIERFMLSLNEVLEITLRLSSVRHPQMDGQTGYIQQIWKRYLRAYMQDNTGLNIYLYQSSHTIQLHTQAWGYLPSI